ncbi:MAG: hypothetical protein AB7F38_04745 [Piscinibacter sp.]
MTHYPQSSVQSNKPEDSGAVRTRSSAGLSFCTETRTRRGRWLGCSHFDVPDEKYADGFTTGLRAFGELVKHLQQMEQGGWVADRNLIAAILADAGQAKHEGPSRDVASRWPAAQAMLFLVAECVQFAARTGVAEAILKANADLHTENRRYVARVEAESRQAFVQRMQQAKRARREAAKSSAQSGELHA